MAHTTCEMMWLKYLMIELDFKQSGSMHMHWDNQSALYIAQNPIFHKRTNHIENDCHLVRYTWTKKVISPLFTPSSKQLTDLRTKAISPQLFSNLCSKLGMIDIYAPTWGGVLVLNIRYWTVIGLWPIPISKFVLYVYWSLPNEELSFWVYLLTKPTEHNELEAR